MKYQDAKKEFGIALKRHREEKKLTQKQVSKQLKFKTCQFVSNIERGVSLPPLPMLGKLAGLYKLNRDKVLNDYVKLRAVEFKEQMYAK